MGLTALLQDKIR